MEKVVLALRGPLPTDVWCSDLHERLVPQVLEMDFPGCVVHVRDDLVSDSIMTLTTLDPPIVAMISVWTQQSYGPQVEDLIRLCETICRSVAAYLVTESVPLPVPEVDAGHRTPGLANIAFLRRPPALDPETWRRAWHLDHTGVALQTQATFGYVQNAVVRSITPGAPEIAAIVEELFPIEAVGDVHAFFGAADDVDLGVRMGRMLESTATFGASENIDTVPTSRYLYRTPFERPVTARAVRR